MSLKKKALLILLSIAAAAVVALAGVSLGLYGVSIGAAATLVCVCLGFAAAGRLKCPSCGVVLAKKLPAGAMILLPLAKDDCPHCGASLT